MSRRREPAVGLLLIATLAALPWRGAAANAFDHTWCELGGGEFRLITDHPKAAAQEMMWRLQAFRPVAERYLPGEPNTRNPPLAIIVFERRRDFRHASGSNAMLGFMQPSLAENLMVVGPDPRGSHEHESLYHEYVHYLLRTRTGINIPPWFDEGLASMLSTVRFESGEAVVGLLPDSMLQGTIRQSNLSVDAVLDAEDVWDWHTGRRAAFYAWSWVLTHRLMLGAASGREDLRPGLDDFLAERQQTLADAIGRSGLALERRLERYLERRHATVTVPVEQDEDVAAGDNYQCLDDSEKVRRLSLAMAQNNPELAARQLRQRLEDDPDSAGLWTALSVALEGTDDREATLEAARRAVELAPEDTSATVRLAGALAMGCILDVSEECRTRWQEAVPLLRDALRQDPTRQDAIFVLGLAYLYSGRAGDALNYLRIAHQRQPWAPHVNFYLGESYRLIGDSRAREHLARARQWSSTELWRKLAEAGLEELAAEG